MVVEGAGVVTIPEDVVVDAFAFELPKPHEEVRDDQRDRDNRKRPSGDVVADRQHAAGLLLNHERHESLLHMQPVLGLIPYD